MTDHPITPPPELVVEWADTIYQQTEDDDQRDLYVATRAAQWGADQAVPEDAHGYIAWMLFEGDGELRPEAREVLTARGIIPATRRPEPPSLKEDALRGLDGLAGRLEEAGLVADLGVIRRALEQLDD